MELVQVQGAQLCIDAVGDPADPLVVLIAGAAASMDWWPPQLCRRIADGGRYVVRYDHRDTGGSTTGAPGAPDYDATALDGDAAELLRVMDHGPAHLVGVSMGGGIAQSLALRYPRLVASLTLVATSPVGGVGPLDPPEPALRTRFAEPPPDPDWTDRDAVVNWLLETEHAFAGPLGIDEDDMRAAAGSAFDRSRDIAAAGNHWLVVDAGSEGGDEPAQDVHDIAVPTLVVHGSSDPLFPLAHGKALAAAIPGARLLVVDGMGHQVPPRSAWPEFVPAVLDVTGG